MAGKATDLTPEQLALVRSALRARERAVYHEAKVRHELQAAVDAGATYAAIGRYLKISRAAVRQFLAR